MKFSFVGQFRARFPPFPVGGKEKRGADAAGQFPLSLCTPVRTLVTNMENIPKVSCAHVRSSCWSTGLLISTSAKRRRIAQAFEHLASVKHGANLPILFLSNKLTRAQLRNYLSFEVWLRIIKQYFGFCKFSWWLAATKTPLDKSSRGAPLFFLINRAPDTSDRAKKASWTESDVRFFRFFLLRPPN